MTLAQLAAACGTTLRGADAEVLGIVHVAQAVRPGWVFAALAGAKRHGIEFAA